MYSIIKLLVCTAVSLVTPVTSLFASPLRLAKQMKSHVFYVEQEGELCPVIDVKSASRIILQLPDKQQKTIRFKAVQWAEKELPPVARITIGNVQGTISRETHYDDSSIIRISETIQEFELVADRNVPDCYVALIYDFPNGNKAIGFGKLGDLKAGDFRNHSVIFPSIEVPLDTQYRYEFFTGGMPLETFRLPRVAANLRSHSLLIPWNVRLQTYLKSTKANQSDKQPQLFGRHFDAFDIPAAKAKGIQGLKLSLLIKKDGSGELIDVDGGLSHEQTASLAEDISNWQFFPQTVKGDPVAKKVVVPMKF